MGNVKKTRPIRLTNKTAIGLRKCAQRVKSAWLIAMCLVTMLSTVLAVTLGFTWLPAVPLTLLFGGVVIVMMLIISRSQYLLLISQAICTEAASRQMEERRTEQKRRERAIEQLAAMRADVHDAQKRGVQHGDMRGEESLLFDLLTGRESVQEDSTERRLSEESDEMYAASYTGDEDGQDEDDLYPPKKSRIVQETSAAGNAVGGNTRPVLKNAGAQEIRSEKAQDGASHRRRRRGTSSQTAPLQLIRNDQAR